MYREIIKVAGAVHLKTDSDSLYLYTLQQVGMPGFKLQINTSDLYKSEFADEVLSIKTYYEKKYLATNKNINYLKFNFV
jgi:tRNA (guanine-N7-)-methyltransferase